MWLQKSIVEYQEQEAKEGSCWSQEWSTSEGMDVSYLLEMANLFSVI